jgi:hypothetical protein
MSQTLQQPVRLLNSATIGIAQGFVRRTAISSVSRNLSSKQPKAYEHGRFQGDAA